MIANLVLREPLAERYSAELAGPVEAKQDALLLRLRNGATVELRIAGREEYAIAWRWGDAEFRIDTAPVHPELPTYPNHLHDCDGTLQPDWLTQPRRDPWDNVRAVIDAVIIDPLMRSRPARA